MDVLEKSVLSLCYETMQQVVEERSRQNKDVCVYFRKYYLRIEWLDFIGQNKVYIISVEMLCPAAEYMIKILV